MAKKSSRTTRRQSAKSGLPNFLRQPLVLAGIVLVALLAIYFAATSGGTMAGLPAEINVDQAYQEYQQGTFVLDVRTVEEWNEFHAAGTTLIPLDQLAQRVNELPRDRQIVVVCRSGNRSQSGRDILKQAGFEQVTSMAGGLNEWRAKGYPVVSGP